MHEQIQSQYTYSPDYHRVINNFDYTDIHNMNWGPIQEQRGYFDSQPIQEEYEYELNVILQSPPPCPKPKTIKLKQKLDDVCSVCFEEFELNTDIYKLKCKHHSHTKCLDKWMEHKHTCPLDRSKIK